MPGLETTRDAILGGRAVVVQPRRGYRFSLDAILLGAFAAEGMGRGRFLDVGAGCGVVGIAIATLAPESTGVLIEIQTALAACARETVAENGLRARLRVVEGDILRQHAMDLGGPFDLVVLNPPFHPAGSGRRNPEASRASARHELHGALADLLLAGCAGLGPEGRLALVHRADREEEVRRAIAVCGLDPSRSRRTRPFPGEPPDRLLVEASRLPGAERALPDLIVRNTRGAYTPEAVAILRGSA